MTRPDGILLVNLGTPERPETAEVAAYLREFLGDPRVIDLPGPLRWFLVNRIIVPRRAALSAANYRKVWTEEGSPLMVHGTALRHGLEAELGGDVVLAMRYGQPSIRTGLETLAARGRRRPLVVPLFPQFAEATTGSVIAKVKDEIRRAGLALEPRFIEDFADHPAFIEAQARLIREHADLAAADCLLLSFHGLPERQIRKADPDGGCLRPGCCERAEARNARCYRARCQASARALVAALGLPAEKAQVAFQSRLGRAKWIEPYTDQVVSEMLERGRRHFVVVSPAFVADCIETLEELGIGLREQIEAAGGRLELVPCVNAAPDWVAGLARMVTEA
ncbi:MAG: ferrochelatase [Planctomycetes bacterium]|nr:ferrochelatase [Planctomycetota bacterium]